MTTEDALRDKLSELAMVIANALLGDDALLGDRIDGLKTLTDFYAKITKQDSAQTPSNGRWGELRDRVGGKRDVETAWSTSD